MLNYFLFLIIFVNSMVFGKTLDQVYYPVEHHDGLDYVMCSFEANATCGYRSQDNMLAFKVQEEVQSISSLGMMVLDLAKVNRSNSFGSRLFGKYYSTNNSTEACLIVKFLTYGPAISYWYIRQRDNFDQCIYKYDNDWQPNQSRTNLNQYWTILTIPINMKNGPAMFFYDIVTINSHALDGFMAFDYIALVYHQCYFTQTKIATSSFNDPYAINRNDNIDFNINTNDDLKLFFRY